MSKGENNNRVGLDEIVKRDGFSLLHSFRSNVLNLTVCNERLYAATEKGVYRMDKTGKRWRKVCRKNSVDTSA